MAQDVGQSCPADQAGMYKLNIVNIQFLWFSIWRVSTGDVGCANTASVNGGNAYIFICNGQEFVLFADCGSPFGCKTEGPKNAVCT